MSFYGVAPGPALVASFLGILLLATGVVQAGPDDYVIFAERGVLVLMDSPVCVVACPVSTLDWYAGDAVDYAFGSDHHLTRTGHAFVLENAETVQVTLYLIGHTPVDLVKVCLGDAQANGGFLCPSGIHEWVGDDTTWVVDLHPGSWNFSLRLAQGADVYYDVELRIIEE